MKNLDCCTVAACIWHGTLFACIYEKRDAVCLYIWKTLDTTFLSCMWVSQDWYIEVGPDWLYNVTKLITDYHSSFICNVRDYV